MLIPFIIAGLLVVLVGREARRWGVSGTTQRIVAFAAMIAFAVATRGSIRVRPSEMAKGLVLGLLMYLVAAAVIYAVMAIWIRKQSPRGAAEGRAAAAVGSRILSPGGLRFRALLGLQEEDIRWKPPLALFLGLVVRGLVGLIYYSGGGIPELFIHDAMFVAGLVLVFHYLGREHPQMAALAAAGVCAAASFLVNVAFGNASVMNLLLGFVYVYIFVVTTIWLLGWLKSAWGSLAAGYYLAGTASALAFATYVFTDVPYLKTFQDILINERLLWRALDSLVFAAAVFALYKLLQLDEKPLELEAAAHSTATSSSKSLMQLVEELADIYRKNPEGFVVGEKSREQARLREIGEFLNRQGGMDAMRSAHREFSIQCQSIRGAARNLEFVWDGIGDWRG